MSTLAASPLSSPASAASSVAPPRPLDPLSGAIVDRAAITFQWVGVPGARGYRFEVSPDRQFARGVVGFDAGPSTELTLVDAVPATDAPLFWRVRAQLAGGPTRWSPYGRFHVGTDDAVDAFRARKEAERAEARKEELRRRAEEEAARDLLPYWEREDTNPSDTEIAGIGLTMILSIIAVALGILIVTLMAS
ncbi:MAG: hypothetical protein HKN04_07750 [Rhodothermaceae bacterium]|nr:hypothetical protein [Rhodothermaceae bacterium]